MSNARSNVPPNNIGASYGPPRKEWYVRKDVNDPWFGPLSFRDADKHARVMTRDGTDTSVKYAQIGTTADRTADPNTQPDLLFVVFIYENGKAFLGGRQAEFNKDKLPP